MLHVPKALYPEKFYPSYVSGGGFVMSKDITDKLFLQSLKTPLIPIDDAFVGILLSGIGKKPTNSNRFRSWGGEESQKCYWWEAITHHKITNEKMETVWQTYLKQLDECDDLL